MKETEVVDRLARIETHLENYNKLLAEHMRRTELNETRITALEKTKLIAIGVFAAISFAIQILVQVILRKI